MQPDRRGLTGPAVTLPARLLFSCLLVLLATACTSLNQRLDGTARQAGLVALTLPGGNHALHSFERQTAGRHALVFIEGDGRPWRAGGRIVSADPTPANPQALKWLQQTSGPALYLGRPCYGNAALPACHPTLWTYSRYSPVIIDSMALGLKHWLDQHPDIESVTLAGYSGGGVLALLLGERDLPVSRVIALSSPLDIHLWADQHGYGRLFNSVNPAEIDSWRADRERHFYFGAQDAKVPPQLFAEAVRDIPGARLHIIEGIGHQCCSPAIWLSPTTP
ncbi:hypothetical protein SAMN05216198_0747 [Halopseudomonas litoralis]|uniref:Alpha/beta hydrolase family protein n=1 Tax=Halopseudomonas litoralis TaxID=797277 RepID=A0A1H1MWH6_9GAMM|nr:hypothetical protein [Halopseudomonas litoralis]SDR91126.1 hypothetical protein SAMN05216198_0747 [Halopseudomonas litoralis]